MSASSEPLLVLYNLSILGINISITSAVIVIWSAALIVFLLSFFAVFQAKVVPGKLQSIIEVIYEFFDSQTNELFGEQKNRWLPFVLALFCFILICNLLGMVPGVYPITANINVTAALAIAVFLAYHLAGILSSGFGKYFKSFIPKDVPLWALPLLIIIEILSQLARPFSLAIRLFANMTAGHLITLTILSLIIIYHNIWIAGFPFLGRIAIGLFEIFVAFVQAYVFAYLAALYIGLAIQEH